MKLIATGNSWPRILQDSERDWIFIRITRVTGVIVNDDRNVDRDIKPHTSDLCQYQTIRDQDATKCEGQITPICYCGFLHFLLKHLVLVTARDHILDWVHLDRSSQAIPVFLNWTPGSAL